MEFLKKIKLTLHLTILRQIFIYHKDANNKPHIFSILGHKDLILNC